MPPSACSKRPRRCAWAPVKAPRSCPNSSDSSKSLGIADVHGVLTQTFERILISRALAHTGGRRIEAAQALGIGRNTITRKIAELGIDGGKEPLAE